MQYVEAAANKTLAAVTTLRFGSVGTLERHEH